ncbi:CHAP domain-containing protein [Staphylococcus gallinarum]|uniref:CHAP domain-containing protein n=1 Tax=Staphylococcus TaxID=1279 RepID=UPI000D1D630E|nr:CHAP domain-containing protein [Staphylococcus gallinarum]MCD8820517.1 CHAP domain-containing protein [Staphylococcus gallinarum]PTK91064.1 CHAP domain-containing protein [Staphylococcus gallinarum]PTL09531.1 CHAP domain-containing protein [Staphylococcus gallinarum]PTL09868.1 CHAP domain-containing protein [Staphylococcus gallinarum]RIL32839.1 CHAP domain-containing protein [Staphylococcus gallinarum]
MKNIFLKGIITLLLVSSLSNFHALNIQAQTYTSITEAKKDHPNATFNKQSDGSFEYFYDNSNPLDSYKSNEPNGSENGSFSNIKPEPKQYKTKNESPKSIINDSNNELASQNNITNTLDSHNAQNNTGDSIDKNETSLSNIPTNSENNKREKDLSKPYKKNKDGMITYIDTDALYDELQLEEFNKKAKTVDDKPLAIGNGKIIEKPAFTNKNNLYTSGQCTWYVFDKRAKDGNTISTLWGDARNWATQAAASGLTVNHKPEVGSILQTGEGPYGHVAYVERINSDGSIFISEMNWIAPYITSTRTISSSQVSSYNFIH